MSKFLRKFSKKRSCAFRCTISFKPEEQRYDAPLAASGFQNNPNNDCSRELRGHAMRYNILTENGEVGNYYFFDNELGIKIFPKSFPHFSPHWRKIKEQFSKKTSVYLGVGKPEAAKILYRIYQQKGECLQSYPRVELPNQPKCPDFPMLITLTSAYIGGNLKKLRSRKSDQYGCTDPNHERADRRLHRESISCSALRSLPDWRFLLHRHKLATIFSESKSVIESPIGAGADD